MNSIDKTRQDKTRQDKDCSHIQNCQVVVLGNMDNTIDHTFESANRVYDKNNLCPTIPTCAGGGIQPKIIEETKCVGGLSEGKWGNQYHQQDRVYKGDIALAQPANLPEGSYKYIVASRGRNPNNPGDRSKGSTMEQRLEMNKDGLVNTLTTVQKDNLVLEQNEFFNQAIKTAEEGNAEPGDIIDAFNKKVIKSGISPTITTRPEGKKTAILPCVEIKQATKEGSIKCKVGGCYDASYQGGENINYVETQYRIRKLTPRECWRLMGYTDKDFEKAKAAGISNSQLYKQAGNAIVKQVLMAIFSQMNIKGVKPWNDMTLEEKYKLIRKSTSEKNQKIIN